MELEFEKPLQKIRDQIAELEEKRQNGDSTGFFTVNPLYKTRHPLYSV